MSGSTDKTASETPRASLRETLFAQPDPTPPSLEEEAIRRKKFVLQKYGTQGWSEGAALVKAHRCRDHMRDVVDSLERDGVFWKPFLTLAQCLWSSEGAEPTRIRSESH
ncbi:hypothetical protein M427DRAFT_51059 [Gonapodya prolifera JEL478]|uniref:Uncharacterized protein n=1 Tax=Gonapodya prolifera (strain JEL478) TaxID=1344416 RepID=A0A139AY25_GONPJ|nr:hypothetical protein M427DRAFT_51059 [Gonapodya prolifera JEL478]|eukprot:KXS21648.1 hypothetical protein M427DRAFT_51059 [Gonapodya prolifera JEL478]